MKDQLETTIDQMEMQIRETIENPYSPYLVQFPYTCSFTIPQDGNVTRVTIETKIELMSDMQVDEFQQSCLNDE
jgi:hypothetical protein